MSDKWPLSRPNTYRFDAPSWSVNGVEFDPNEDRWQVRPGHHFVFDDLRDFCSPDFLFRTKKISKYLFETRAEHTALTAFSRFRSLCRSASRDGQRLLDECIATKDFVEWVLKGKNRNYINILSIFTNVDRRRNLGLFSNEAHEYLETLESPKSGDADAAIRSWDPDHGAYRPSEDKAILTAINDAFSNDEMKLRQYFIICMLRGFGMRPLQLAHMKVEDIRDGVDGMKIHIPLVKQRGTPPRGTFMPWKPVTQGLANTIKLYLKHEIEPITFPNNRHLAPIVPFFNSRSKVGRSNGIQKYDATVDGHSGAGNVTKLYVKAMKKLKVISPVYDRKMTLNPRRERHTYATQLAMNGATAAEIAINLGQSVAASCEPYIDATIGHFQSIEAAVGEHYIGVGDRFLGKVIPKSDCKHQFDLMNDQFVSVGACSANGCNAVEAGVAPIACYTCRKFNAWEDGPHEAILERLLVEQKTLNESGHPEIAETKAATIIAVSNLLAAIQEQKSHA